VGATHWIGALGRYNRERSK